ncbi:MAG: autotransporter outer membrane beta-barrel domain-containing protein [Puniceicoccales bacterium]|jgi:outer membrane autotransporter protein|nr:autotransporter outer membrane beta-barrel domain-containing protein [Puniceicoccales bacterium]
MKKTPSVSLFFKTAASLLVVSSVATASSLCAAERIYNNASVDSNVFALDAGDNYLRLNYAYPGYGTEKIATQSGAITGTGDLVVDGVYGGGGGVLVLSAAGNSYVGKTVIDAATLRLTGLLTSGAHSGSIELKNGGVLDLRPFSAQSLSGNITGEGNLFVSGTNAVTLASGVSNTFTGKTIVYSGATLTTTGSSTLSPNSSLGLEGGTLDVNNTIQSTGSLIGTNAATIRLGTSGLLTIEQASLLPGNYAGVLEGGVSSKFTKTGSGALTLNADLRNFEGDLAVSEGKLVFSNSTNLKWPSALKSLALSGSGEFDISSLANGSTVKAKSLSSASADSRLILGSLKHFQLGVAGEYKDEGFAGKLSGAANSSFSKNGTGTFTLTNSNTDFAGQFIVLGGTLALSGAGSIEAASGLRLDDGTTFDISGTTAGATVKSLQLQAGQTGAGTEIKLGAKTLTVTVGGAFAGKISGMNLTSNLVLAAPTVANTLTLSGKNTYAGATTITGGLLKITGALGASVGGNNYAGDIALIGGNISFDQLENQVLSGVVSGSGILTKAGAGTLELSKANTYTGTTHISGGTLELSGTLGADSSNTYASNISINASTLLISQAGAAITQTLSGVISGNGSLVKTGASTLVLTGNNFGNNNAYSVRTTVSGGTLDIASPTNLGRGANSLDNATLRLSGIDGTSYFNSWAIGANGGTLSADNDVTFTGALTGGGSITKTGQGTLTLAGNNTGINNLTVSAGAIAISLDTNLGSGVNTLSNGATLALIGVNYTKSWVVGTGGGSIATNVIASRFYGDISGPGPLVKVGTGVLEVHGAVTAPLRVSQGTLAGTGTVGQVSFDSGTTLSPGIHAPGVRETPIGTLHLAGTAGTLELNGVTLRVNLYGTSVSDLVEISGKAVFGLGDGAQNTVDIHGAGVTWGTGAYTVLQTTDTLTAGDLSKTVFQYAGVTIDTANSRLRATLTPVANTDSDGNEVAGKHLVLNTYATSSINLTWNQGTNANTWNKGADAPTNWHENGTPGRSFVDGDVVNFADQPRVQKSVVVATQYENTGTPHNGVVVGGMSVSGTKFYFSGGKITGLATGATGPGVNADGKLVILANASAHFANDLAFVGVDVAGEGTFAGETNASALTIESTGKFTVADGGVLTVPKVVADGTLAFDRSATSASVGARYDTFAGNIEGTGSLEKTGTGLLILTGTNIHTGGTKVLGGTLSIASDKNIGAGQNTLNNATLKLTGRYYEADWTLGATGGTVEFDSSRNLVLSSFYGAIGGDGPLTKSGTGILQIANANTYTGTTTLTGGFLEITGLLGAPANAILPPEPSDPDAPPTTIPVPPRLAPAAVGNYAGNIILNGGGITFASDNDQVLTGTISNKLDTEGNKQGTVSKNGEGLLKLEGTGKSHSFNKFLATKGETVVEGTFLVNTFENGVAKPTATSQPVLFTANVVNAETLVNYANGNFRAETITTTKGAENFGTFTAKAINGDFTNRLDAHLDLVATQTRSLINGALRNSGTVKFSAPGQVLEVKSLSNAAAQMGIYELSVDFANPERSNYIQVAADGAVVGHHLFRVTPENLSAVTGHTRYDLVRGGQVADNATFFLESPIVTGFYELGMGGANDTALQVVGYSPLGRTFLNATAMISTSWFSQLDNISKRQGGLRLGLLAANASSSSANPEEYKPGTLDVEDEDAVWLRAYGQQVSTKLSVQHVPNFKEYQGGADVGYDHSFSINSDNKVFVGAFVGFQASTRNFNDGYDSKSDSRSILGGFYGTWANSNGWYLDSTIKAQRIYTEYRLNYSGHGRNHGEYNQDGLGFSVEAGKRFNLGDAWFIEPGIRIAVSHFLREAVSPSEDLRIDMDASTSIRYGVLLGAGKTFTIDRKRNQYVQPYAKLGLEGQSGNGGRISVHTSSEKTALDINTDDVQGTIGLGVVWQLDSAQQLHVDYEASIGEKIKRPWVINVGYGYRF